MKKSFSCSVCSALEKDQRFEAARGRISISYQLSDYSHSREYCEMQTLLTGSISRRLMIWPGLSAVLFPVIVQRRRLLLLKPSPLMMAVLRILLLVPCPYTWLIALVRGLLIPLLISLERRGILRVSSVMTGLSLWIVSCEKRRGAVL